MKVILGIIGQNGSGKTTVTEYLKSKCGAVSFRFSDPLKDILDRLYLEDSRQNFQTLSTALRQKFSEDILSTVTAEDIKKTDAQLIIAEGVRRPSDITYLKELPGFYLVHIKADAETRYARIKNRTEKSGDQSKTWEEFLKEEQQEPEQKIKEIAEQAEYQIDNNGALEQLYQQLDKIISVISAKQKISGL